jgi:hypothetical protein
MIKRKAELAKASSSGNSAMYTGKTLRFSSSSPTKRLALILLEFPEFLGVLFSNSLKAFTKPGIQMLKSAFFSRNTVSCFL